MTDFPEWAAFAGMATNKAFSIEDRLGHALRAVELLEETLRARTIPDDTPAAWKDLITGLTLLARGQTNDISPLRCDHDQLTIMADPHKFTKEERVLLDELGFFVDGHDSDGSDGDEGYGTVESCNGEYCESMFVSFRFGNS